MALAGAGGSGVFEIAPNACFPLRQSMLEMAIS